MVLHVRVNHKGAEFKLDLLVELVLYYFYYVKTGENGVWEVDVIHERKSLIVTTLQGIGSCDYSATSIEICHNTGFGDGDSLLLHSFVNRSTILFIHLIELINKAEAFISQDHCSSLQFPLACLIILFYTSCQSHCRCTFASGINTAVENFLKTLKELWFGDSRITK